MEQSVGVRVSPSALFAGNRLNLELVCFLECGDALPL